MLESKKTMREIDNSPGFIINEGLNAKEYEVTVKYIRKQWINTIRRCNDGLARYVVENDLQIWDYHQISDKLKHEEIWPKCNRILPKDFIEWLSTTNFANGLKEKSQNGLIYI